MNEIVKKSMTKETLRLHFIYVVIILVMVIIAVATDKWTTQENFTEYLSNAATLTSLVLALVAIFYSMIANDGISQSLGNITSASDNIRESKEEISRYAQLTDAAGAAVGESSKQIQVVSAHVDSNVAALNSTLMEIKAQTKELHESISSLPSRLDQLEINVLAPIKSLGEKQAQSTSAPVAGTTIPEVFIKRFLDVSPLTANLLTIACVRAFKTSKRLDLSEFVRLTEANHMYSVGYATCMSSAQIIKIDFQDITGGYKITFIHPVLEAKALEVFLHFVDTMHTDSPEKKAKWLSDLASVEKMFA